MMEQGAHCIEVMDSMAMDRALMRIAHEIIERNHGVENLAVVGVHRRGVPLAMRIAQKMKLVEGRHVDTGTLDITLYRDDLSLLSLHPVLNGSDILFSVDGRKLILVDDVLFTGRTARAAMDAVMDMGRPRSIQLVSLIDRGHRELPIHANYVGKSLPTSMSEIVSVRVREIDGRDEVLLIRERER